MFNPIQFSKSHVNRAHPRLRNKSQAVVKTADQAGPPPQLSPAQSNPTSHLLRGVRGRNNWRPGQCVRVCLRVFGREFTCAWSCKNASALVAQGRTSARFNSPLNATATPGGLCVAAYLHRGRYGKNLWTRKSLRLHGSSHPWPQ